MSDVIYLRNRMIAKKQGDRKYSPGYIDSEKAEHSSEGSSITERMEYSTNSDLVQLR